MKNDTTNEIKTPEQTSYQKLLKTLDDEEKAYKYQIEVFERAKNIVDGILSVTTGNNVIVKENNEWGHGLLLELFEILSVRHKNFYIPDFLENLSDHVFNYTFLRDNTLRNWKKETLAKRGLDEYGIPLETPAEEISQPKAKTIVDDEG
jgi:hypothetical protein